MQQQGIPGLRFVLRYRGAPAKRREVCLHRDGSARESRHFDYERFVVREPERQRGSFEIPPVVSGMRLMEPHNANVRSCWRDRSSMLVADSSQRATTIVNAGNGLSANGPMYKVN